MSVENQYYNPLLGNLFSYGLPHLMMVLDWMSQLRVSGDTNIKGCSLM